MEPLEQQGIYEEVRERLIEMEVILKEIREKTAGIPFVEKNLRVLEAVAHAFENGIPDLEA